MIKQVIVVRKDLNMRKGKIAAQVAHAAMQFLTRFRECDRIDVELDLWEVDWFENGFTKIVVGVDSEGELEDVIKAATLARIEVNSIVDEGVTEFHGVYTLTCAAIGPYWGEEIDKITGKLGLL